MHIAVIGCGGIGSFFIATLDKLIQTDQVKGCHFECFDDDVVETKNILYQNFEPGDVDDFKTEAMCYRYVNVQKYTNKRVTYDDMRGMFDLVLLCADNNIIRRDAYRLWNATRVPFIDARSNGRTVGIFSSNTEVYLDTITDSDESFSCQYPYQLEKKEIELGNVVVASMLAQALLNYTRKKKLPSDFMYNF
jgi:hypothetical protein